MYDVGLSIVDTSQQHSHAKVAVANVQIGLCCVTCLNLPLTARRPSNAYEQVSLDHECKAANPFERVTHTIP